MTTGSLSLAFIMLAISAASNQNAQAETQAPRSPNAVGQMERLDALESKVEYLNAHHQITELLTRFFRGVNRSDGELIKSTFWPDARIHRGVRLDRREDLMNALTIKYMPDAEAHQHHVTNHSVEISGDVAHIESYVLAFWRLKDKRTTRVGGVRYLNRVERRGNEWRIAAHDMIPTFWIEADSIFESYLKDWPTSSGCAFGTLDRRDPSYRRPLDRPGNALTAGPACATVGGSM